MLFVEYPSCTTCRKAKQWLLDQGYTLECRNIKEQPPTYEELREWYVRSGLPIKRLFNTSGLVYKSMQLKDRLPTMTEEEQLRLLSTDGMLVKRPIIVDDEQVYFGFRGSL